MGIGAEAERGPKADVESDSSFVISLYLTAVCSV